MNIVCLSSLLIIILDVYVLFFFLKFSEILKEN